MADIPTVVSAKGISRFLGVVSTTGIPAKVDTNYLKSVGFKSGNDTSLIGAFKQLGFIDSAGVPTGLWKDYKDKSRSKALLGAAVKSAYTGLFALYPDAERKDDEAIRNWMRTTTGSSEVTVTRALATFKALVSQATFDDVPVPATPQNPELPNVVRGVPQNPGATNIPAAGRSLPSVNINIELQIPATNDPKVYENFFAAMKKNLLDDES